jgi:hypothetical protein
VLVAGELIGMQATPETRARVRRAVGSRAAPLCVLSLFRLQTAPTERSLGVLLLVFDSEYRPLPVHYYIWVYLPKTV